MFSVILFYSCTADTLVITSKWFGLLFELVPVSMNGVRYVRTAEGRVHFTEGRLKSEISLETIREQRGGELHFRHSSAEEALTWLPSPSRLS